jgi:hypothetical protein
MRGGWQSMMRLDSSKLGIIAKLQPQMNTIRQRLMFD